MILHIPPLFPVYSWHFVSGSSRRIWCMFKDVRSPQVGGEGQVKSFGSMEALVSHWDQSQTLSCTWCRAGSISPSNSQLISCRHQWPFLRFICVLIKRPILSVCFGTSVTALGRLVSGDELQLRRRSRPCHRRLHRNPTFDERLTETLHALERRLEFPQFHQDADSPSPTLHISPILSGDDIHQKDKHRFSLKQ